MVDRDGPVERPRGPGVIGLGAAGSCRLEQLSESRTNCAWKMVSLKPWHMACLRWSGNPTITGWTQESALGL